MINEEMFKMYKYEDQCDILAKETATIFTEYLSMLQRFKKHVGLKDVKNIFEIYTSMTDKNGRIGRHVKHKERNDPKPEWPNEVLESISGYMAYTLMLLNHYNINSQQVYDSMLVELKKSIDQHSEKQK